MIKTKIYPVLNAVKAPNLISFSPFIPVEVAGTRGKLKPELKRAFVKQQTISKDTILKDGYIVTFNPAMGEERWAILIEDTLEDDLVSQLVADFKVDCMLSYQHYKDLGKFVVIKENTYQSAKGSGDYTNE